MTAGKSKSTVLEKIQAFLQTLEPSFPIFPIIGTKFCRFFQTLEASFATISKPWNPVSLFPPPPSRSPSTFQLFNLSTANR